ncbi:glycosyltransferase family 39 protein [Candidatus Woesearchaeota archaeon]|nr:glycosyltransferase family 39 protein [Candidatus Woesearchaeota archaeon]
MKKQYTILILIFILTLAFRLYFVFQSPNFDYEAYFNVRQINQIIKTGFPLLTDNLSYGGRSIIFIPFIHYILAFFSLILTAGIALKLLPNIAASSIVIIVYLIAKKLTKKENISLITAFISAFIPIYIIETINSVSVYSITLPLMFLVIYFLMELEKESSPYLKYLIILIILLPFIHSSVFILTFSLIIYLILIKLAHLKQNKAELELILFSIFLTFWIEFIIFKNAFLAHGPSVIWQNVPSIISTFYFIPTNFIEAVFRIGLIPLIGGIYVIYRYLFREKNKPIYLLISFAAASAILLWLKLIQPNITLAILGIVLTILFAKYYQLAFLYIKKTRVAGYKKILFAVLILIFILTSVLPCIYFTSERIRSAVSSEEIKALLWLKTNTPTKSTVLGPLSYGHIITAVANRKNVIDSNFLLIQLPEQHIEDVETIYTSLYKTEAVRLLNEYSVDYIIFSPKIADEFNIEDIKYIDDEECFELVYDNNIKIYESLCKLEEIKYD